MYAIVATGGKQYRVALDDVFAVEKLNAEVGSRVELPVLLLADGKDVKAGAADLDGSVVTAEVVEHTRGAKVIVFKFKKRKGYKRTRGHRQELTVLRVVGLPGAEAKPAAKRAAAKPAAKAAPKPAAKTEAAEAAVAAEAPAEKPARTRAAAKPKAETAAAEKPAAKPAAKKPAAKPAAKKPAAKAAPKAAETEAAEKPAPRRRTTKKPDTPADAAE